MLHINNSLNPCSSHKDRHANIGAGHIGLKILRKFVNDEAFAEIHRILETPWFCGEGSTKKTIAPYKMKLSNC